MATAKIIEKLDTKEIVKSLLLKLSKKERDIISRRFGLKKEKKETLETVGKLHNLTRERIRQIENNTIKKIKQLKELGSELQGIKGKTVGILKEHGGLTEKNYLFHILNTFSPVDNKVEEYKIEKNHYDFILSRFLEEELEEIKASEKFKNSYKLKYETIDHLEELAEELVKKITEIERTVKTKDLIDLISNTQSYVKHKDKLYVPSETDISSWWKDKMFDEDHDTVHSNKILYSLLHSLKHLEQNKFGFWGVHNWGEVKPKTINDKIYLVLKNGGKPMHFVDIAKKINEIVFDNKIANPATVHNELILDERYVLVGRGIYGLKEWGYKEGIVSDVIIEILKESGPLTKEEIIEKVLANRLVKKTTINLALTNKEKFEKTGDKYQIKK